MDYFWHDTRRMAQNVCFSSPFGNTKKRTGKHKPPWGVWTCFTRGSHAQTSITQCVGVDQLANLGVARKRRVWVSYSTDGINDGVCQTSEGNSNAKVICLSFEHTTKQKDPKGTEFLYHGQSLVCVSNTFCRYDLHLTQQCNFFLWCFVLWVDRDGVCLLWTRSNQTIQWLRVASQNVHQQRDKS